MPDGTRWNFHSWRPRTIVWPALLPPWKRTMASARSASRSVTLPLPSSPNWAPTITIPGISVPVYEGGGSDRSPGSDRDGEDLTAAGAGGEVGAVPLAGDDEQRVAVLAAE